MNALSAEFPASTPPLLSLREEDFCRWIGEADPGDRIEYHRGLLAADRVRSLSLLANADRRELGAIADRALDREMVLNPDDRRESERSNIPGYTRNALAELRPYGVPSAAQGRIEILDRGRAGPRRGVHRLALR